MKIKHFSTLLSSTSLLLTGRLLVLLALAVILLTQSAAGQQPAVPKLSQAQVEQLVSSGVPDSTLSAQIQKRGLAFTPTPAIVESLRAKGAGPLTLSTIEGIASSGVGTSSTAKHRVDVGSGFNRPSGVAVDESGNIFVFDAMNGAIKEILAGGYTTVRTLVSGLDQGTSIAVDRGGNVFFSHPAKGVKEILAADGFTTVRTVTDHIGPNEVAVDAYGNVFFVDSGVRVAEILAQGGYRNPTNVVTGLNRVEGLAVDGDGNIFVTETDDNVVKEILAGSGYSKIQVLGGDFKHPIGIAVDRAGNVFVTEVGDYSNKPDKAVKEIHAAGGYKTVTTFAAGFRYPVAVALDRNGSVYVADSYSDQVVKVEASGTKVTPNVMTQPTDGGSSMAGNLAPFLGVWNKVDPGGYVKVNISKSLIVHIWGACESLNCDQGEWHGVWDGSAITASILPFRPGESRTTVFRFTLDRSGNLQLNCHYSGPQEEGDCVAMSYRR